MIRPVVKCTSQTMPSSSSLLQEAEVALEQRRYLGEQLYQGVGQVGGGGSLGVELLLSAVVDKEAPG